ncbi:MAG TPA: DEAD/DEAH box helicase [Nitrolancea sp.]|nr:DEAD/DEAH box helicase [Nitrolancea sp.]
MTMTNSRASASDVNPTSSSAFESYDPRIQRWIWGQGWQALRDIQERAAEPILRGDTDVIIASATASGKTEAAYFPILTRVASRPAGLKVLAISPLKALINDQFGRLTDLCEPLELPVYRWHGDVPAGHKKQLLDDPSGILLITPESLEALFITRGTSVNRLFADLDYVVVDELHAFIGTERGMQLQSLLHRVERAAGREVTRIALSATLGDMAMASDYLRLGRGAEVVIIESATLRQEVRLQIRGYRHEPPREPDDPFSEDDDEEDDETGGDTLMIAADLFNRLRGGRHLVFANSRRSVEMYTDILRRLSDRARVPNEFWPHHGNLSRELRHDAEERLRESLQPTTIISTSTLELGIDVGSVESIAQIGAPPSVASMRQRLGRSGRKAGSAAILRLYIQEETLTAQTLPQDALRTQLVQTIAMVRLLVEKWNEPPERDALHLSTLVQQTLSLIAQHGGGDAAWLWRTLCQRGPFRTVDRAMFARFLRALAAHDLIDQMHDGTLLLGLEGEHLVNHFEFYAAFASPDEYRLVYEGKTLGTLPVDEPIIPGMFLIFGGRRWQVVEVDAVRRQIDVVPSAGGRPPKFTGAGALVHDRVRQEMFSVYLASDQPPFLDATARELLDEGRDWFRRFGLDKQAILDTDYGILLFPWVGDRVMNTLLVQLMARGLAVEKHGPVLTVYDAEPPALAKHIAALARQGEANGEELARRVANKRQQKHHPFLTSELLSADYASSYLDTAGALAVWQRLAAQSH